ncbi:MAG: GNAT family N-acetyltransferase [Verrucomicrobiota bacterium]
MNTNSTVIRLARNSDIPAIADIWYRSGRTAYSFLPDWKELTPQRSQEIIAKYILPHKQTWLALESNHPIAFLCLQPQRSGSGDRSDLPLVDRLYVYPSRQGEGIGTQILNHSKALHPEGLELYTHQANHPARRFYEKRGFLPIAFGLSPHPESAPDVKYRWTQ